MGLFLLKNRDSERCKEDTLDILRRLVTTIEEAESVKSVECTVGDIAITCEKTVHERKIAIEIIYPVK